MTTRHNACVNPGCGVDASGWGGGSVPARVTGLVGMSRTTGARYTSGGFITTPSGVVNAGDVVTLSVDILTENFDDPVVDLYFEVNGGTQVGPNDTTSIQFGVVKRVSITRTIPVGGTTAHMVVDGINFTISPTSFTGALIEIAPSAGSYFDGTVPGPPTSSWDGTAELSASTLTDTPTTVTGSAGVALGGISVAAIGQVTKLGSATVDLNGISVSSIGQRTANGRATINLAALTVSASAITGGPIILPDDMYQPGPCHDYEWVSFCEIPLESAAVSGYAVRAASEILYYASGQRFDSCQVTIRPCRKECWGDGWPRLSGGWWEFGTWPQPVLYNGAWYNIACGMCGTSCSCSIVSETILPGPVQEIVQVTVDGEVLDPVSDYRLDDYRKLVRLGGELWPLCNNLNLGITEVGTWSVTAIYGEPLPTLGKFAMGQLLCQILADVRGDDCSLPDNVTDITRQGVSFTMETVEELVKSGFTDLKYVNQFIQRYNPNKLAARPRLYDVDGPDFRVTGTTIS